MGLLKYFHKGTKLLDRKGYALVMTLFWLYSLIWILGVVALAMHWEDLNSAYKILISVVMIIGTPAIRDLFQTYDKYKETWSAGNES